MKPAKNSSEQDETCPTCGKRIAEESHSGSLTSYLFQSFNCTCGQIDERLTPRTVPPGKKKLGRDSLSSFCPVCGLENERSALGSITGFLFQDIRCKCQGDNFLSGEGMVERFIKLKEAEADKIFASVTQKPEGGTSSGAHIEINLLPGAIIGGNYTIRELLGKGGMGEVYLATHLSLKKNCAIKVIPPDQVTDMSWKRFQNEAKAIASLDHINLVKVTDLGLHGGCLPFYAMDYVDGVSLLDKLKVSGGSLPLNTVLDIFMQVCDGVHHAHRKGVVHRDIKPANIMLVRQPGDKTLVKILDFGLVKLMQMDRQQQSLTRVGEVFGTPFYMSPEQCMGGKIDIRSDVYSVGCSMFEALTGRVPFMEETAVQTITAHQSLDPPSLESIGGPNRFPVALEVVMVKLLRKNPVERYQTLQELKGDLQKVARRQDVEPYYMSRNKSLAPPPVPDNKPDFGPVNKQVTVERRLSKKLAAGAIAFIALSIASAAYFVYTSMHKEDPEKIPESPVVAVQRAVSESKMGPDPHAGDATPAPPAALDNTPYSRMVTEYGRKWRVFNFPTGVLIGRISDGHKFGGEVNGVVRFPYEDQLSLQPEIGAVSHPGYLRRFRKGDIYTCILSKYSAEWSQRGSIDCIKAMTEIPGVEHLDLRNTDDMDAAAVAVLDDFKSVRYLELGKAYIDTLSFSRLKILKNLRDLQMSGTFNMMPVLSSMRNSTEIRRLALPCSNVTLQSIDDLSTMPNLETLIIAQIQPNDPVTTIKAIKMLGKNGKLKELSIRNLIIRPDVIAAFKAIPGLKILRFAEMNNAYSTGAQQRLFADYPSLELGPAYLDSAKLPRH